MKKKEPIDPKETPMYNHYKVSKDKPVISNQFFKESMDLIDAAIDRLKDIQENYGIDQTQKTLLLIRKEKLKSL
jgi:hypothetical protein